MSFVIMINKESKVFNSKSFNTLTIDDTIRLCRHLVRLPESVLFLFVKEHVLV